MATDRLRRIAPLALAALVLIAAGAYFLKRDRAFEVRSDDGRLALAFGKGALMGDVKPAAIAAEALADVGGGLRGYELRPSGAAFRNPTLARYTRTVPDGTEAAAPAVFLVSDDGRIELVDGVVTVFDIATRTLTTTFPVAHFSRIYVAEEALMRVSVREPDPEPVGSAVRLEAVVTPRYGQAELPPDWGPRPLFTPEQIDRWPELEDVQRELNEQADWFRRMRTFEVPGQGLLSMATADYAGSLEVTGAPILEPASVRERPKRGIVTAPLDDSEVVPTTHLSEDFICKTAGQTEVVWKFGYTGYSHRGDVEETAIAAGEFMVAIPVACGEAPTAGDEDGVEYVEIIPESLVLPVRPQGSSR